MKKLISSLILTILLITLTACGKTEESAASVDVTKLTPQQLVETYYTAISNRDFKLAESCLEGEYARFLKRAPDSDFTNLRKLTVIKISPQAEIRLNEKSYDEVQVVAEYDATYKKVITSHNGNQTRFIYVGKKDKDAPWKIVSIGTGP